MKRLMPASLISFLANAPNTHREDCFLIKLPTGQILAATTGQWDITIPAGAPGWVLGQTTFSAAKYGSWSRGRIVSEASTSCASNTMELTCIPQQNTNFPALGIGILNGALNGLFDAATVTVYTVYFALGSYGDTSHGVETKFYGTITRTPKQGRNIVKFDCADPMYLLNMKVPSRVLQSNCGYSFADGNCGLNAAQYSVPFTGFGTGLPQPDGYFTQGVIRCLTGANAGLSVTVKAYAGGVLTSVQPWLLPVQAADTFQVIRGCDKTAATCAATRRTDGSAETQDFRLRFGGTPFVPAASSAI